MKKKILKVLKKHFHYNDYKLGEIADEIVEELNNKEIIGKYCWKCINFPTLPVTYIGENPNLCQKGRKKGDAINCPYYCEKVVDHDGEENSIFTKTFR